jgi:hypothetical protein
LQGCLDFEEWQCFQAYRIEVTSVKRHPARIYGWDDISAMHFKIFQEKKGPGGLMPVILAT